MLEAWRAAPLRGKVYGSLYLLLLLLAITACCVPFGARLFHVQSSDEVSHYSPDPAPTYHFYYDRIETPSGSVPFSAMDAIEGSNRCPDGGRLLVAFASLSFLLLLVPFSLALLRTLSLSPSSIPHPRQSLLVELIFAVLALPLYLIALTTYASLCYAPFQESSRFFDVRATGFAFHIVGFFLLLLSIPLAVVIRKDEGTWLGVGGDGGYGVTREVTGDGGREGFGGKGRGKGRSRREREVEVKEVEVAPVGVDELSGIAGVSYQQGGLELGGVSEVERPVPVRPKGKAKPRAKNYESGAVSVDHRYVDYTTHSYSYQNVDT